MSHDVSRQNHRKDWWVSPQDIQRPRMKLRFRDSLSPTFSHGYQNKPDDHDQRGMEERIRKVVHLYLQYASLQRTSRGRDLGSSYYRPNLRLLGSEDRCSYHNRNDSHRWYFGNCLVWEYHRRHVLGADHRMRCGWFGTGGECHAPSTSAS